MIKKFDSIYSIVKACDSVPLQCLLNNVHYSFVIDSIKVGTTEKEYINDLQDYKIKSDTLLFKVDHQAKKYTFQDWCSSRKQRDEGLAAMLSEFRDNKIWPCLQKWRDELYPIYGSSVEKDGIFCTAERASCLPFGFRTFGVHINGYVSIPTSNDSSKYIQTDNSALFSSVNGYAKSEGKLNIPPGNTLKMWAARRSKTKQMYPSMLDQIVAGGTSAGEDPSMTVIRECEEEAGIPELISKRSVPRGSIQYITTSPNSTETYQPETQYVYDLELPLDFVPVPTDGEVESFYLLDMHEVY
ncbi:Nudix hydrolase 20, chloroplastic, partial [Smittium culicis]